MNLYKGFMSHPCGDETVNGQAFVRNHLAEKIVQDQEACSDFCMAEFGCLYLVFFTDNKKCWPTTSRQSTQKDNKAISGQKKCV